LVALCKPGAVGLITAASKSAWVVVDRGLAVTLAPLRQKNAPDRLKVGD
jgi:hypothetical protein